MPSSVRPKGSGVGSRAPPVTPMSERQQMALLMQMTSSNDSGSRSPSSSSTSRSRDRNERGETPLHLAAIKGDVEQVCKLLAHRADPNAADFAGWTPLHEACNHGWYEVAFRLVQAGANVNAKGLDNDTPLHDAAANGHLKLVKLLVERGADIHAKNSKGKTPLEVAPASVTPYLHNPSLPLPSESTPLVRVPARPREDKNKICPEASKTKASTSDDTMETKSEEDVYEFKASSKDTEIAEEKPPENDEPATEESTEGSTLQDESTAASKRHFSEVTEQVDESANNDEETRRKRRKEDPSKDAKSAGPRGAGQSKGTGGKQGGVGQGKQVAVAGAKTGGEKKSPCGSPNPAGNNSDAEAEDGKTDLKVPPLKIVIPQTTSAEQETGTSRNGKNSSQRAHSALPYVVASSNSNDSTEKEIGSVASPEGGSAKPEEKREPVTQSEEQKASTQRVLRSSHRSSGTTQGTDRGSNNSSPQLQRSHSPSPSASPAAPLIQSDATTSAGSSLKSSNPQSSEAMDVETDDGEGTAAGTTATINTETTTCSTVSSTPSSSPTTTAATSSTTSCCTSVVSTTSTCVNVTPATTCPTVTSPATTTTTAGSAATSGTTTNALATAPTSSGSSSNSSNGSGSGGGSTASASVELHPRKRKMKSSKDVLPAAPEPVETQIETQIHPHDQPITNCYQLYLNIRKQIDKRRRGLFPVQPKPPQGFKDYLMNRCTYVLASNAPTTPNISHPPTLPLQMKDLFTEQEKERYRLRMQHVVEKEKLVLSVEQEILRVHGRAARALANQSLPFSVCTVLRDEEVYNLITPEQEEKDRNARSRYNGRLFLSWLQDVDDKWEKIKEHMLLRHHNEAESLHAVQKMDWEWKMKELNLCDRKSTPTIDEHHVPMVHVSDDFDLLPA